MAYQKPQMPAADAANNGYRVAQRPAVRERLAKLKAQAAKNQLLSYNKRLELLAENALIESRTPAERNAQTRAIEVYTRIAGDGAPERHIPPGATDESGERSPLRVIVDIFRGSPSHMRNVTPYKEPNREA